MRFFSKCCNRRPSEAYQQLTTLVVQSDSKNLNETTLEKIEREITLCNQTNALIDTLIDADKKSIIFQRFLFLMILAGLISLATYLSLWLHDTRNKNMQTAIQNFLEQCGGVLNCNYQDKNNPFSTMSEKCKGMQDEICPEDQGQTLVYGTALLIGAPIGIACLWLSIAITLIASTLIFFGYCSLCIKKQTNETLKNYLNKLDMQLDDNDSLTTIKNRVTEKKSQLENDEDYKVFKQFLENRDEYFPNQDGDGNVSRIISSYVR